MMVKLGIAIKDLGPSQMNFQLIEAANALVTERSDVDVIAFYENIQRHCMAMNFAAMQLPEAYAFDGVMVATSFSTAQKVLQFPGAKKKFFYVWDLEWLRQPRTPFRVWQSVYGSKELTVLARGSDHANVLQQAWNRDVQTLEDFDLERLIDLAK